MTRESDGWHNEHDTPPDAIERSTSDPRLEIPEVLIRPVKVPESLAEERQGRTATTGGWTDTAKAWAIALDFILTIAAGAVLGWLFDRWQGTAPTGSIIGFGLGFVLALIRIIRRTLREERKQANLKGGTATDRTPARR